MLVIHMTGFKIHGSYLTERRSLTFIKLSNFTYKQMKLVTNPELAVYPSKRAVSKKINMSCSLHPVIINFVYVHR